MNKIVPIDQVRMRVTFDFRDKLLSYQHEFPTEHMDFLCRPRFPADPTNGQAMYDFQHKVEMRKKIIDLIANQVAAAIASVFERDLT